MPNFSTYPQVKTPAGRIALNIPLGELVPFLDRILDEAVARDAPPPDSLGNLEATPPAPAASIRRRARPGKRPRSLRDAHPDHHLWNNNGFWWVVCTIYPTPVTKERLRQSLSTRCVNSARLRRDEMLAGFAAKGILAGSVRCDSEKTG